MKDRLKKIIDFEDISYSKFADLVGIQRSGVSHLINGRNNPSLDVIQKVLEAFNYINAEWLLLGKGNMIKDDKKEIQDTLFKETNDTEQPKKNPEITEDNKSISDKNMTSVSNENKILHSQAVKNVDKKIVKIVIFHSDKTFTEYMPEN